MNKDDIDLDTTIHDLKVLGEYFFELTNGTIPKCIEDSINILEEFRKEKNT